MDSKQKAFAAALTAAREAAGLTQLELGEKVGRTQQAVAKWENGESMPTRRSMGQLINVLPELEKLGVPFTPVESYHTTLARIHAAQEPTRVHVREGISPYTRTGDILDRRQFRQEYMSQVEKEFIDSLPETLRPNFDTRRRIDYESDKIVVELYQTMHAATPTGMILRLWALSTERLRRADSREYYLVVMLPGSEETVRFQRQSGRLYAEAYIHGIIILTAQSPQEAAEIIAAIEKGEVEPPTDENNLEE